MATLQPMSQAKRKNFKVEKEKEKMARERMVTRTVFETVVDVMVVNTDNAQIEVVNKKLTFQPDDKTALKYLQKH